jgi:AraC family transcriptional regulator, regulatory protein of adaptative response / DNA-3-methyladenine glycosylase II
MASCMTFKPVMSPDMNKIIGLNLRALDRARLSRDSRFDGKFFIAVTSTGIYCRPICPSRTSRSSNVRYYPTAAAAAEAGFRPCLRCRPEAAPGTPAWLGTSAVVRRALKLIDDGVLDEVPVEQLAARLGIGSRHLDRLFLQHVGASPIAVAQTRRLHFAKRLLDETNLPITEIALAAGFGSVRRFNDVFQQTYQRAPREMRSRRRDGVAASESNDVALKLAYRPPYDWEQVRGFFAARAVAGVERVDEDGYSRTVELAGAPAVITVRRLAGEDALELRVRGAKSTALFHLSAIARRAFDLAADPVHIATALKSDMLIAPLMKQRPGLRIPGAWDAFECAVRAVLGQQVTIAAGRTFAGRLVARLGVPLPNGTEGLTHLFPGPKAIANGNLAGLGLTGARESALKAVASAVIEGRLDFGAPVEEVTNCLGSLPGVGEWTAQYVALRALGEPDAFPAGDVVLRRVAAEGESPLGTKALEALSESWRPWRGYAAQHLWAAAKDAPRVRKATA